MKDVRVLVVEQSNAIRAVLRRFLDGADGISYLGEVDNLEDALLRVDRLDPHVLVIGGLLVESPAESGRVRKLLQRPAVVIAPKTSASFDGSAFQRLGSAPAEILTRPEVPRDWATLARRLPDLVRQLGEDRCATARPSLFELPPTEVLRPVRFLALGASTGGPGAVRSLLSELGSHTKLGVAIVQHMSPDFEDAFVAWLASELPLDVSLARDGERLGPGRVRIGRSGAHLTLQRGGIIGLETKAPPKHGHHPSIDVLFRSLAAGEGRRVVAVLLSGMGRDGAEGLLELHKKGAITIVQEESTCAVAGMPRAALQLGAASLALPPAEIGRLVAGLTTEES